MCWASRCCPRGCRPSRQQLWEDALFSAVMSNEFDKLAHIQTKDVPAWRNKGQSILQAEEDVVTALDFS
eukprot:5658484-Amphidinium_carterae.1